METKRNIFTNALFFIGFLMNYKWLENCHQRAGLWAGVALVLRLPTAAAD
jgi:hypothetical protein